jgi:DNA polymerase-3 subunit gamma/tau
VEYLVLARKWRPQIFEDVLGQEHVVRTLANAITQKRIAHAFLFSGPRGVGKTSIARILAKAINCDQGPTPVPCNKCSHCREITDGIAIDVREIDGASNRGIDEIRELRENVKFVPTSCHYKVYIIDEVHMLTREAFNALLKTLEEPPAHVIFIFATTETHKVPSTILSRCQCFDFRRISIRLIAENLKKIAEAESVRISDTGLAWIAEAGDGSLRDSQSIFDQVISYAGFEIEDRAVEEILGRSDRRFLFLLSDAVLGRDAGRCLKVVDDAYYAGLDMKFFYQTLLSHFRNLLLVGIAGGGEGAFVDLPADELERLRVQVAGLPVQTLQRYLELLMTEEESIRRSQNVRLNLEAILCRMAWLEPLIPIETLLSRMEGLEGRLIAGIASTGKDFASQQKMISGNETPRGTYHDEDRKVQAGSPDSNAKQEQLHEKRTPYGIGDAMTSGGRWNDFKDFVKRQDAALCAKIESAQCLACEEGSLRIGFTRGYLFREDVDAGRSVIEAFARQFFGQETALRIETLVPETGGLSEAGIDGNGVAGRVPKNHKIQEIRREALSHPFVQKVLDVFPGAEVREVRLREVPATAAPASPPLDEDEVDLQAEEGGLDPAPEEQGDE